MSSEASRYHVNSLLCILMRTNTGAHLSEDTSVGYHSPEGSPDSLVGQKIPGPHQRDLEYGIS